MSSESVKGVKQMRSSFFDWTVNASHIVVIFLLVFIVLYGVFLSLSLGKFQLHNVAVYQLSRVVSDLNIATSPRQFNFYNGDNKLQKFNVSDYQSIQALRASFSAFQEFHYRYFYVLILFSLFLSVGIVRMFSKYRYSKFNEKFIRGSQLVDDKKLIRILKKEGGLSSHSIGSIPLPNNYAKKHMGLYGDTGVGKSQQLLSFLFSIRDQDKKVVILDKSGEFIQHLYDPEKDVILSPFDERSHNWTPFLEGSELFDFERLSRSFIPTSTGQKDDHWPEASVTVLSWLLYRLYQSDKGENIDDIFNKLIETRNEVIEDELGQERIVKVRGLNELLEGTLAELVIDPESPEHAASVIASIVPKIRALWYLRGLEEKPDFSFREWASNDEDTRWVFIKASEDELDAIGVLVSAWIDTVIKTVISLPKSADRDIKVLIDELQSLDKINTLEKGVFEMRKYGGQLILGFTSPNALYDIYGQHKAQAMLSSLPIKLIYRTSEPTAAKWNANVLGEAEKMISRKTTSVDVSRSDSETEMREKEFIVSPSEIQNIPDLNAYLKLGGGYPSCKVTYKYIEYPVINAVSVKRDIPASLNKESEAGENVPAALI